MSTNKTGKGLKLITSWVHYVKNPEFYINPAPGNMQQRGRGHSVLL